MRKTQILHKTAKLLAKSEAQSRLDNTTLLHYIGLIECIVSRLVEGGASAKHLPSQAVRIYTMSLE